MKNIYELEGLLTATKAKTEITNKKKGVLFCKYDDVIMTIRFEQGYCLYVSSFDERFNEVIGYLVPILTTVMGNEQPLCSYQVKSKKGNINSFHLEWDVKFPNRRVEAIQKGAFVDDFYVVTDIVILGMEEQQLAITEPEKSKALVFKKINMN